MIVYVGRCRGCGCVWDQVGAFPDLCPECGTDFGIDVSIKDQR